ncbi:Protein brown, partial [Dictyocoela roeselum]
IASVHQPSSLILNLFDDVVVLHGSRLFYNGRVCGLKGWIKELGFDLPEDVNVADFLFTTVLPNVEYRDGFVKKNYYEEYKLKVGIESIPGDKNGFLVENGTKNADKNGVKSENEVGLNSVNENPQKNTSGDFLKNEKVKPGGKSRKCAKYKKQKHSEKLRLHDIEKSPDKREHVYLEYVKTEKNQKRSFDADEEGHSKKIRRYGKNYKPGTKGPVQISFFYELYLLMWRQFTVNMRNKMVFVGRLFQSLSAIVIVACI